MLRKILFVLSIAAAACGPASGLSAPDGFAHLGGDRFDDRIGSASGVVVATRVVPNEPQANLDFWAQAIDLRLQQRGYDRTAPPKDVKSPDGLRGRCLQYTFNDGTRENRYFVDVYATSRRILLVEATGATADFDASLPKIVETMRSVHLGS